MISNRLCSVVTIAFLLLVSIGSLAAQDRLTPAPAGSFGIVVIPDTQAYHGAGTKSQPDSTDPVTNQTFEAHTRWIADNLDRQKIVFVSHVGDIVDKNERSQWEVARACMDVLHGKVPYGIAVGNHDMTSKGDSSLFQEYFPEARFDNFPWYGGAYEGSSTDPYVSGNNANSFQLFSAGGMDFVFLHLECNAPDDVLQWANGILEKYSDRRAMITTHMGWGPEQKPTNNAEFMTGAKGRMQWVKIHGQQGNTPQQMWDKCYCKHANLFAVFSGDQSRTQAIRAATPGDHGNVVHELLQDYSTGWLRLYRFLPADDCLDVFTFDPKTEELCEGTERVPDRGEHQFRFAYEME
jgi:hypothetical protein